MKSVIFTKERELALALMKVAELTSQLEHLRRTRAGDDGRQSQVATMFGKIILNVSLTLLSLSFSFFVSVGSLNF